jgi:hypothetical protein
MKPSLKIRITEWWYWHVSRKTQKFVPWVARKLPKKLQYYAIVAVAVKAEPNENPGNVTASEMMKFLKVE